MGNILEAALTGFSTSLAICVLLVLTKSWHGSLTLDGTVGVQKFHTAPTPRVGGLGLMLGLCASAWTELLNQGAVENLLTPILIAGLPAFLFGTAEDLTKRVGVRERLLATMASGVLAWWLTGTSITRVDVWGLDSLLTWLPLSVAFTAFAVGGVANAVNIIDGFNGLASGTLIICYGAMGLIAWQVGDHELAQLCLILTSVTAGFFLVNFPLGKIFLGDGGAYLMGFLLAWVAVLLPARNSQVSVWAPLLVCGYPILEVLFSVWRKYRRVGHHPGQPDKVHLHMLMFRRVTRFCFRNSSSAMQNGLTSPTLWPFSLLCAGLAVAFHTHTLLLIFCLLFVALCYHLSYVRLTQFKWQFSSKKSATKFTHNYRITQKQKIQ
jgi:UDP-N-acetylmuramyl pentapeptide phosphotransferase/UDP-N-acetylglucosamine-1-phosphate transferase